MKWWKCWVTGLWLTIRTEKALCSNCLPSHHKLCHSHSPFCHRLLTLCPAVEARQKEADCADGSGQVAACFRSFQSSLSSLLLFQKLQNADMHPFQTNPAHIPCSNWKFLVFLSASMFHSDRILELSSDSLLPFLQLASHPCWFPPLTSPGLQIKREQAISWADNGTWHLYCEVIHTQSPKV